MQINIHDLQVNPLFDTLLHALHPQELEALKESMLAEGWRAGDPAKVWGDTIIDGHNRYRMGLELGITEVPVTPVFFDSDTEAKVWILRNQVARRNTPEQIRSLYVGQLVELLKGDMSVTQAVSEIASKEERSARQVWRDIKTVEAFENASPEQKQDYIEGGLSAKELIDTLKPLVSPAPPPPKTKEELEEQSRAAFPAAIKTVSKRFVTGINNLKALANDIEIVCKHHNVKLEAFAPIIAAFIQSDPLTSEKSDADLLTRIKYKDGTFIIAEPEESL